MDFTFTEEQQMLQETMRRFIAERCGFSTRHSSRASQAGYSAAVWKELAELGLLALNVSERFGGMGAGPIENMVVCNAIGEGLLLEPFLSSAVIATHAIATLASAEQCQTWLPKLANGDMIAVLAHDEASTRYQQNAIETVAVREGDGWRIDGRKTMIYHAASAQLLLITARVRESSGDTLSLFAIATDSAGLALREYATVDSQRAADITLGSVWVASDARLGEEIRNGLQATLDFGLAAFCAEAFGCLDRTLKDTIDYCRSRNQFGVPIGSFQALQHRMADMLMHVEQARSMSYLAASICTHPDAHARHCALSAAKALIGQAARYVGQQALQLHGGMGMTDEMAISHHFRRLLAFELRMGSTDQHLEQFRQSTASL